jgi:hypothetical protein
MEILIIIGGIAVAIALIVWLFPVFIGLSIVAFLAWVVANITGLPFWGAVVLLAVVGLVGFVLLNIFD